MSTILKPFLLAVTLMLILISPGFATENGAITMVKTYSAYDYLQTRARLMHAVNLASIGRCVCTSDVANKCAHIVHYLMR